jgi:hypothetical protein
MLRSLEPAGTLETTHDKVRECFEEFAKEIEKRRFFRRAYLQELIRRYRFYIEPGARVLEIGVGTGDLLASVAASRAAGIDISPQMLSASRVSHPELELYELAAENNLGIEGQFDYIILSDLTVHLYDILQTLKGLRKFCHSRTRIIFNFHSRLWQPILSFLSAVGLHHRHYRTNWITTADLTNLMSLAGFDVLKSDRSTLIPVGIPMVSGLANRYLSRLPLVKHLCLVNWVIARVNPGVPGSTVSVSVICPCRNEAGNIPSLVRRLPPLGVQTELIFVEGGSTDGTWEAIQHEIASNTRKDLVIKSFRQQGRGKGDAVRLGFSHATGDVFMILDGDLSVSPEELPAFLEMLTEGKGEFINGSRLVYPMNDRAMRFLNLMGNKFFALAFSYLLDQPIKDTLCGTKVLTRRDYDRIANGRSYFGDFDPFGDFDLLFGAAKLNLKIVELPIRYRDRTYGTTNISRFRHGWLLLQMSLFGLRRLKFL